MARRDGLTTAGGTRRTFPLLTAATLGATSLLTATRLRGDGVMHALWRDPHGLEHGQVWRLVSPVLVQSDRSPVTVVAVFAVCAVVGAVGERVFSRAQWIALYLAGAVAGHSVGEAFQPRQSGTSVAFVGILGGLAAYALLKPGRISRGWRVRAAIGIPLAVVDTVVQDIHGVAFLAGLAVAAGWTVVRRRRASVRFTAPPEAGVPHPKERTGRAAWLDNWSRGEETS